MAGEWVGVERRHGPQAQMMQAIADEPDPKMRALLTLVYGMFEELHKTLSAALADTDTLKRQVLNGHTENHHDDHTWVTGMRNAGCEPSCCADVAATARQLKDLSVISQWAKGKMEAETLDAAEARKMKWGIKESVITALILGLAASWLPKIFGST